jgi:hypothetical protein
MTMFQAGGAIQASDAETKLTLARSCLAENKVLLVLIPAKVESAASRHHWGVQYGQGLNILSLSCQPWHKTRRFCSLLLPIFLVHSSAWVVAQPWILLEKQSSTVIGQSVISAEPAALQAVSISFQKLAFFSSYCYLFALQVPVCHSLNWSDVHRSVLPVSLQLSNSRSLIHR